MCICSRCQQCGTEASDTITSGCSKCTRIFCDDCVRDHGNTFPDHGLVFRNYIERGIEYYGSIEINSTINPEDLSVLDMKSVKEMAVIILVGKSESLLRVYGVSNGKQHELREFQIELDTQKSQIAIIDDNTVAITVPCSGNIHIVNLNTGLIRRINSTTDMTGAIAFIDNTLYIACIGHIQTMKINGENLVSIIFRDIQSLHPLGMDRLYCVSKNPVKNLSYFDITNNEEHQLSEFPFHPNNLTFDACGNMYFISNKVVWKATYDGKDYKVVLSERKLFFNPKSLCFDISNNLLFVYTTEGEITVYRQLVHFP